MSVEGIRMKSLSFKNENEKCLPSCTRTFAGVEKLSSAAAAKVLLKSSFETSRRGVHHSGEISSGAEIACKASERSCERFLIEKVKLTSFHNLKWNFKRPTDVFIKILSEKLFRQYSEKPNQSNVPIDVNIRSPNFEHPNHVRWNLVTSKFERMNISEG